MDSARPKRSLFLKRVILAFFVAWVAYLFIRPSVPEIREAQMAQMKGAIKKDVHANATAPQIVDWGRRYEFNQILMFSDDEGMVRLDRESETKIPPIFNGTIMGFKNTASGIGEKRCIITATFYLNKKGRLSNYKVDSSCRLW